MQGEAYDIRDEGAGCVWNAIVHPINDDFHKISEEIFFFENWKKLTKSEEIINVAFAQPIFDSFHAPVMYSNFFRKN